MFALFLLGVSLQSLVLARTVTKQLQVPNGGQWGNWRGEAYCPSGQFAVGFDIKVEDYQFTGDDTGLNGISLICSDKNGAHFGKTVSSGVGDWGSMKGPVTCNQRPATPMFLTAFSLEVEGPQGNSDDTAANWIKFQCRDIDATTVLEELIKDPGTSHIGTSSFGPWSETCPTGSAICGLQTKVESSQGGADDTALNNVLMYCCDKNDGPVIG